MGGYLAKDVVRPLGLEPRTCGLRVRCSANCARGARTAQGTGRLDPFVILLQAGQIAIRLFIGDNWGDRGELNPRPPVPQTGALTN